MRTKATDMFENELPIFAFSHCRDVVAAVSRAGGVGVLGCAYMTPQQLRQELSWIDDHVEGRPYGVDLLMPGNYQETVQPRLTLTDLPEQQSEYMRKYCDDHGLPPLPEAERDEMVQAELDKLHLTPEQAAELIDVALEHPIKLVVNALGAPPKEMVEELHGRGIKVGSLIGKLDHVARQLDAGVDILIAQGHEAGGHTGDIASLVLWPQIVDAVAPVPVLAAGGVGRGRQMAAALALGAEGVWCGSIWLNTTESELLSETKECFHAASSHDAIRTRSRTGKPVRMLRSKLTEAWEEPDAPAILPMPLQTAVMAESRLRMTRARNKEFLTYPIGQIVGDMEHETTCRQVIQEMLSELVDASERLNTLLTDE